MLLNCIKCTMNGYMSRMQKKTRIRPSNLFLRKLQRKVYTTELYKIVRENIYNHI